MIIKKGTRVEVKGIWGGKWKEFVASEDFNLKDQRWKLLEENERENFEPLGARCKLRFPGSKKVIWKGED